MGGQAQTDLREKPEDRRDSQLYFDKKEQQ